ncbi:hypothetical protein LZ31DRAFT_547308 [Colletotrichum somersetense]|nr:hypothetical protein LZ31DRAFT_547308 [Colletotrichum somersetense]
MAQTRWRLTSNPQRDCLSFRFRGRTLDEILHPVLGRRNQLTWTPRDRLLCRQYLARLRLDHAAVDLLTMDNLARSLDIPSVGGDGTGGELFTREEWAAIAAKMCASLYYILSVTTKQGKLVDRWDPVLGRRTLMWPDKLCVECKRPVELKGNAVDPGVAPQEAEPEQEHQNMNDPHHLPLSRPEAQQQSPQSQEEQGPQQSVQHQEPSSPNTPPRSVKGSRARSDAAALMSPPMQHRRH